MPQAAFTANVAEALDLDESTVVEHLRAARTSSGRGARVNVCLNHGTLNVNDEYVLPEMVRM